jgi:hypothetical protein
MCTVSVVPIADGLRLMCNRDERNDRPHALAPDLHRVGAREAMMPIDPTSGGTWIGANHAGVAACLLNRYPLKHSRRRVRPVTRGGIVPRVLECDSMTSAIARATALDPRAFEPFRLVLVARDEVALLSTDGDQQTLVRGPVPSPLMFTGSALGDFLVDQPRRRLFECLFGPRSSWIDAQPAFHAHQWPNHRDISVLMERADARTVSRTTIDVVSSGVRLHYEALAC